MNKKNFVMICVGVILLGAAGLYVVLKVIAWPTEPAKPVKKTPDNVVDVEHEEITENPKADGPENIV